MTPQPPRRINAVLDLLAVSVGFVCLLTLLVMGAIWVWASIVVHVDAEAAEVHSEELF